MLFLCLVGYGRVRYLKNLENTKELENLRYLFINQNAYHFAHESTQT